MATKNKHTNTDLYNVYPEIYERSSLTAKLLSREHNAIVQFEHFIAKATDVTYCIMHIIGNCCCNVNNENNKGMCKSLEWDEHNDFSSLSPFINVYNIVHGLTSKVIIVTILL